MAPEDILAAVAARYAGLPTYRDAGRVETLFVRPGRPPRAEVKPFETAFVRPDRFRFEYRSRHGERAWSRHLVWAAGADVRTWWDISPGVRRPQTLEAALASAAGVSGRSSVTVAALLLPDRMGGFWPGRLADLSPLADAPLDGVVCHRLAGREVRPPPDPAAEAAQRERSVRVTGRPPERAEHGPLTLLVERDTLLLRRVEGHTRFETFRAEAVTSFDPAAGTPVADDALRFDPPAGGADGASADG